jgi:hypothetical protein
MLFIKKNEDIQKEQEAQLKTHYQPQPKAHQGCGCGSKPLRKKQQVTKEELKEIIKKNKSKFM